MAVIRGDTLESISATTLWTLHDRASEAKSLSDRPALADTVPRVRAARDIKLPPDRGLFKVAAWPPLDRIGLLRRNRPSITLLEFDR